VSAFQNHSVVTLLEILEASAEAWWRLASGIGQLFVRLEVSQPPAEQIVITLAQLRQETEKLGLTLTTAQLDHIRNFARQNAGKVSVPVFAETLRRMVLDLHMRALDELEHRFFLVLDGAMVPYYKQNEPLCGTGAEDKFPQTSEDISEAGKCLALGRSTAAVFHLMRAMESVVTALGAKLGVTINRK
jgi:hypothetical protein